MVREDGVEIAIVIKTGFCVDGRVVDYDDECKHVILRMERSEGLKWHCRWGLKGFIAAADPDSCETVT